MLVPIINGIGMSGNNSLDKGNKLEDAAESIYRLILATNPGFANVSFKFDRKKIIKVKGVRREIDLYVEVDPGHDMESIFIFECKNREEPVSANDIVIFSRKILDTNATKGFFIAKSYTKDALAEAENDSRMIILNADDANVDLTVFPIIHSLFRDKSERQVSLKMVERGIVSANVGITKSPDEKDPRNLTVTHLGKEISLRDFIDTLMTPLEDKRLNNEPTQDFEEGVHTLSVTHVFTFEQNNLIVENHDIEKLEVSWTFNIRIAKPRTIAKFDIKKKGLFLQQEMVSDTGTILVNFTALSIQREQA